jgi:hypothetical protein
VLRVLLHSMSDSESASGVVELRPPAELSHIPVDVFREFIGYLYRDTVEKDKLKVRVLPRIARVPFASRLTRTRTRTTAHAHAPPHTHMHHRTRTCAGNWQ